MKLSLAKPMNNAQEIQIEFGHKTKSNLLLFLLCLVKFHFAQRVPPAEVLHAALKTEFQVQNGNHTSIQDDGGSGVCGDAGLHPEILAVINMSTQLQRTLHPPLNQRYLQSSPAHNLTSGEEQVLTPPVFL